MGRGCPSSGLLPRLARLCVLCAWAVVALCWMLSGDFGDISWYHG